MPAIAAFLKGTVSESLTKLVQPAGLVPATFFVLLNLGFIYPTAVADKIGIAQTFSALDGVWQTVTAAAVVFALGYLLLNSANIIIETLSGENWRRSILGAALVQWHALRRQALNRRITDPDPNDNRTELLWELNTRFPPPETYSPGLAPTRFGNVLAATQFVLYKRYGIEMTALWAPLENASEVKDAPALDSVKDEKSTLDLLANTIFILIIFIFECLGFFGVRRRWHEALVSLLLLPIAYVVYRVAVRAARTWGDSVLAVYDLHRDDLRKALGLRDTAGIDDERGLWRDASGFYLPGADGVDEANLFTPRGSVLSVSAPASLAVTVVSSSAVDVGEIVDDRVILRAIDYSLLVARIGEADRFGTTDVIVEDARVTSIAEEDVPPPDSDGRAGAKARRSGDAARLIWAIRRLGEGTAMTLDYRLPTWQLTAEPAISSVSVQPGLGFRLEWPANTPAVALTVEAATPLEAGAHPRIRDSEIPLLPVSDRPARYRAEDVPVNRPLWVVLP